MRVAEPAPPSVMSADAGHWVRALSLAPHPEGGWFRETFRSPERLSGSALPARFGGERSLSTSILYLLSSGERSLFHRLKADELWWHHGGGAMHLYLMDASGARLIELGGDTPQAVVPHGTWFAAEPAPGAAFALVGCGVTPGFEFEDLELAERDALIEEYPAQRELVLRFTQAHPVDGRPPEEPAWP